MSSKLIRNTSAAFLAALVIGCAGKPAHANGIRFCLDQANPMFSIDQAVANAVAAEQNTTAVLVVRNSATDDHDDDSGLSQQKFFAKLSKSCDLIMGFPVEAQVENLPDGMAATTPYARTGFVTATTGAPIHSFATMVSADKIGVVFLTVASTYFTVQNMASEHVYESNDELYGALLNGEVNAALIWQPWLNRQLSGHPQTLHVARLDMPHADWNIVALYPQGMQGDATVRMFNAGIASLHAGGKLSDVVHPYAVPATDR